MWWFCFFILHADKEKYMIFDQFFLSCVTYSLVNRYKCEKMCTQLHSSTEVQQLFKNWEEAHARDTRQAMYDIH